MKLLILFAFCVSLLLAQNDFGKYLSSEVRAEVYAQNLVEEGYYKNALSFLDEALVKYPKNEELLMFHGTSSYNLKELSLAKKYFMLTLEVNPANEQASSFIELIEVQESSKENKTISEILSYLSDSGLDFIMIFLAFLGGEIIAKKYAQCSAYSFLFSIAKYNNRKKLSASFVERLVFSTRHCCLSRRLFSFCTFLEGLIVFTIVTTLLILWLMLEFYSGFALFINESFTTLSAAAIWQHAGLVFLMLLGLTLIVRFLMQVASYENDEQMYLLEVCEQLEILYENKAYVSLRKALLELKENKADLDVFLDELSEELSQYIRKSFVR